MSIAGPVSRRDGASMRESRLICGIDQVCVVVRDLDGALETMTAKAGIGPFKTWTLQSPWVWHTTYRGRRVRWSMRLGLAYVGGIQWEVIQPANGPTLYGDYIGRYGDGLHHLLISPRGSRHHALARLAAHGAAHAQSAVVLKAAQVGPVPLAIPSALAPLAGARFGYADTFDDLGAYLELVSYPFGLPGRLATRLGKPDRWVPGGCRSFSAPLEGALFEDVVSAGFVVPSARAAAATWSRLAPAGPWRFFPGSLGVNTVARALAGSVVIELVEPADHTAGFGTLSTASPCFSYVGMRPRGGIDVAAAKLEDLGCATLVRGHLAGHDVALVDARRATLTHVSLVDASARELYAQPAASQR